MKPVKPGISKASATVQDLIRRGSIADGARLPSLRALASSVGVSLPTMWKAVQRLSRRGVVSVKQGSGIYVGAHLPVRPTAAPVREPASRRVADLLRRDLLDGWLRQAEVLPSVKELQRHYRTGHRTLQAALAALVSDRLLERLGRPIRITRARPARPTAAICFLMGENVPAMVEWNYYRSRIEQVLLSVETECSRRNVRLVRQPLSSVKDIHRAAPDDWLGVIVYAPYTLERHAAALGRLADGLRAPVVLFDDLGTLDATPRLLSSSNLRIVRFDERRAGMSVGNALLSLGHRSAAFFCGFGEHHSALRHEGLARSFSSAGYADRVRLFTGKAVPQHLYPIYDERVPAGDPRARMQAELKRLEALSQRIVSDVDDPAHGRILRDRIYEQMYLLKLRFVSHGLFDEALRNGPATAWVFTDDTLAVEAALPFLAQRGKRPARDLSLVSFNNGIQASIHDLSSYDFDIPRTVARILNIILEPRRREEPGKVIETEGVLVQRGSLRAAGGIA